MVKVADWENKLCSSFLNNYDLSKGTFRKVLVMDVVTLEMQNND